MDAVGAVSALAMALAVAWADCVMSCCGVSSVAMSQSQMIRSGTLGGRIQKWLYLRNHQSDLAQTWTECSSWGALPTCVVVGGATLSPLASQHHQHYHMHSGDAFLVLGSHSMD